MNYENIVLVCLAPAVDKAIHAELCGVENFRRVHSDSAVAGGKTVNIAKNLHEAGYTMPLITTCGKQNYYDWYKLLNSELLVCNVMLEGAVRENTIISDKYGFELQMSVFVPAVDEDSQNRLIQAILRIAKHDSLVIFSGGMPCNFTSSSYCQMISRVKSAGLRVAVDTAKLRYEDLAPLTPYLIKPNAEEFCDLVGEQLEGLPDYIHRAKQLVSQGFENILLTLGADGLVLINQDTQVHIKVPPISVVDTVGAGDASLSGFLLGKMQGLCDNECAILAAAYGMAACQKPGTQAVTPLDAQCFVEKIKSLNAQG